MNKTHAWSSYWLGGQTDSFVPQGMEKPFAELWLAVANELPDNTKMLDLCCGNGAIASLLEQIYTHRRLDITGVDAAIIEPKHAFKQHDVTLKGETNVAELPFEESQFDAVVSQYGIEYCDTDSSLKEAARVAKPGAKFVFLMHTKGSAIAETSEQQLQAMQAIQQSQFFTKYAEFFELLDEVGDATQIAAQIRIDELNKEMAAISKLLADKSDEMGGSQTIVSLLEFANEMFVTRTTMSLKQQLERLAAAELMNMAGIERMKNMLDVSMDETQVSAFVDTMKTHGIDAEFRQVNLSGHAVGYLVTGKKHG